MFYRFKKHRIWIATGVAVWLLFTVGSCCEESELELSRVDRFISSVGKLSLDSSIFWGPLEVGESEVVLSLDAWSQIPWFDAAAFGIDISSDAEFELLTTSIDVDNDAVKEKVMRLQITNPGSGQSSPFFFKWAGDKYTVDAGNTYLGWMEGRTSHLVVSRTQNTRGGMICVAAFNAPSERECSPCTSTYRCGACDEDGSLSACIASGETGAFTTVDVSFLDTDSGVDFVGDSDSATGTVTDTTLIMDTTTEATGDSTTGPDVVDTATIATDSSTGTDISLYLDTDSETDINIGLDTDTLTIDIGGGVDFGF